MSTKQSTFTGLEQHKVMLVQCWRIVETSAIARRTSFKLEWVHSCHARHYWSWWWWSWEQQLQTIADVDWWLQLWWWNDFKSWQRRWVEQLKELALIVPKNQICASIFKVHRSAMDLERLRALTKVFADYIWMEIQSQIGPKLWD